MVIDQTFVDAIVAKYKAAMMHISLKLARYYANGDIGYHKVENDSYVCFSVGRSVRDYEYDMDIFSDEELILFNEIFIALYNKYVPFHL